MNTYIIIEKKLHVIIKKLITILLIYVLITLGLKINLRISFLALSVLHIYKIHASSNTVTYRRCVLSEWLVSCGN